MSIKCNLSTLMGGARLTITKLSEETGLSRNTIAALYHDKETIGNYETIDRLCEYFDCPIGVLFTWEKGDKKNEQQ